jgi:hypothetical protein
LAPAGLATDRTIEARLAAREAEQEEAKDR